MATNVRLDQEGGTFLHLEAPVVKAVGSDFMLDSPERRKTGTPFRRALVHDQSDGLTVNFNGDYPGGVAVNGNLISLNGPAGTHVSMNSTGKIGATNTADQVTIHGTVLNLDTLQADGNSAGEIRVTLQHPGDFDQDGNQRTPDFPETLSLGDLFKTLRDDISFLQARVTALESK